MAINACADRHCTELGVVGHADCDATLRFSGPLCDGSLYLNDRDRNLSTPVTDGLEYRVKGESLGSLFLSDTPLSDVAPAISITLVGGEVVVTSHAGNHLDVDFYSADGKLLKSVSESGMEVRYRPAPGVIIVNASDSNSTTTKSLII